MDTDPKAEKPKLWFITSTFGSSSEAWMYRQAAGIKKLQVRVLTHEHLNREVYPAEGFELEVVECWRRPPIRGFLRHVYTGWKKLSNRSLGGFIGSTDETTWWQQQSRADRPICALIQYGPDALRFASFFHAIGVPVVVHFHGYDLSSQLNKPDYHKELLQALGLFSGCVVVAQYMKDWLLQHGLPEQNLRLIPCGVPMAELTEASDLGSAPCRFLAVGRLVSKKRPDLTIRAFAECIRRGADARLTIIGDGPFRTKCEALIEELQISEFVQLLGTQPITVVKQQLQAASAFVQHSVTSESGDKEGWPVSIAEAAGAGLPVVSTRHASIPEQVEHETTGLLCEESDWQAMAEHMFRLAGDPQLRQQMGRAAKEKISQFDTKNQVRELENFLLEIGSRH